RTRGESEQSSSDYPDRGSTVPCRRHATALGPRRSWRLARIYSWDRETAECRFQIGPTHPTRKRSTFHRERIARGDHRIPSRQRRKVFDRILAEEPRYRTSSSSDPCADKGRSGRPAKRVATTCFRETAIRLPQYRDQPLRAYGKGRSGPHPFGLMQTRCI